MNPLWPKEEEIVFFPPSFFFFPLIAAVIFVTCPFFSFEYKVLPLTTILVMTYSPLEFKLFPPKFTFLPFFVKDPVVSLSFSQLKPHSFFNIHKGLGPKFLDLSSEKCFLHQVI